MAMRFAYYRARVPHPVVTLGGQTHRLRPLVDLTIIGPGGSIIQQALLDTGADEITFPENDAVRLGIDLSTAPSNSMSGVGSPVHLVRYANVRLRMTDGHEFREWPALVGFTAALRDYALFGYTGGLQFFTASFHGDRAEVELEVNPTYPGT